MVRWLSKASGNYGVTWLPPFAYGHDWVTHEMGHGFSGYDGHVNGRISGEAIVIHKVDTALSSRNARVVDPDNNGNPNDAGAMWLPGETFTDMTNGITVRANREQLQREHNGQPVTVASLQGVGSFPRLSTP